MKSLFVTLLIASFFSSAICQSKKDFQAQMDSLIIQVKKIESMNSQLESELKNLQLNLTNVTNTMSFVSKSNLDLEAQVKTQLSLIQKLIVQNDSLLKVFNISGEAKFVVSPANESDSIVYVIQNYFKAKKWEDRLIYVLNAEKVKPLMASTYQNGYKSEIFEKALINITAENYQVGKTFKVFVDGKTVYMKKTNEGFKIDWEAITGYNAKSFALFHSEKSTTPTVFRCTIKLDDYYTNDYGLTKSSYVSLLSKNCLYSCWIPVNIAGELKKILSDGQIHEVIVEAQYKTFYTDSGYSDDKVIITKFIKDGWDQ
jgi:hypothetical protein